MGAHLSRVPLVRKGGQVRRALWGARLREFCVFECFRMQQRAAGGEGGRAGGVGSEPAGAELLSERSRTEH